MIKENDIQNTLPSRSCYAMISTALGGSQSAVKDLKKIGTGIYSYTVYVPDEAKASIVGCLMNSSLAKGNLKLKSFEYDESGEDKEGFCINVEEKIY